MELKTADSAHPWAWCISESVAFRLHLQLKFASRVGGRCGGNERLLGRDLSGFSVPDSQLAVKSQKATKMVFLRLENSCLCECNRKVLPSLTRQAQAGHRPHRYSKLLDPTPYFLPRTLSAYVLEITLISKRVLVRLLKCLCNHDDLRLPTIR